VATDEARVEQEKANVVAAVAEAERAAADKKRYMGVGEIGVSESQIDLAVRQSRSSDAAVDAARARQLAAESQVTLDKAMVQTSAAKIEQNEASVRQAELNLSYTQVKAPASGFVTHRTVEIGAYFEPGEAMMAIVPKQVWIVANFKESQLKHMRPRQPVEVRVDAYPSVKFTGYVDSIQHGSGANFSLLPPENATGNYVKVVQRVPVKIVLDESSSNYVIGPGMSVDPKVTIK
jgi:membrane fusion protein (multidrug efflux system)